ncbi:MAG: hypothetical protein PHC47_00905 [Clostridia bacterium]|nr:hypothetical protein [Clostridia bacterium]
MKKNRIEMFSGIVEESGAGRNKIFTNLSNEEMISLKNVCSRLCSEKPNRYILNLNTETENIIETFLKEAEKNQNYKNLDLEVIKEVFSKFYLAQNIAKAMGVQSKSGYFSSQEILSAYKKSDFKTVQKAYQAGEINFFKNPSYAKDNKLMLYVFEENINSHNLQKEINDYISLGTITLLIFTNQPTLVHYQTTFGSPIESIHDYSDETPISLSVFQKERILGN